MLRAKRALPRGSQWVILLDSSFTGDNNLNDVQAIATIVKFKLTMAAIVS
jgi:hypothetical protein